ncbi:MAG: DNA polymerase III subunit gamma/tau [Armatimonadota bacterium]
MAYQSLYRKYRSRDFSDLVGQRHITQTLANAISSDRVAHAYLFCGPRGTGKTSTARVLAKALNCVNGPTDAPCGVCHACVSVKDGSAMDVVEIDAASNRNIDDIRQLREQVNYPPVELRYKFYIVDEVHQLTRDSFNAFLKTLEEPPGHVIFVLCTTDPHQLPATILSRCQRFDFHRITRDDIIERLRWVVGQEGWTVEDEALYLLARAANGGLRDALSLLDQAASYAGTDITAQHVREILGGIDLDLLIEHTNLVLRKDAEGVFHLIDRIMSEGKDVPQLVGELIQHWRNLLRVTIGGGDALLEMTAEQRNQLVEQARLSNQTAIMRAVTMFCEAENELRWNSQQRLLLELVSIRIMSDEGAAATAAPEPRQAAQPAPRPAPRPEPPAPTARFQPSVVKEPAPVTPVARTPEPPAAVEPSAPADDAAWTLPRVKKAWPQFLEWMGRSPNLANLRARVVEKCWPVGVLGKTLKLATASNLTRSQVYDRPQVKTAFEQCLQSYFKSSFVVDMEVQQDAGEALTAPPAPAPVPVAPAPDPTPGPDEPTPAEPVASEPAAESSDRDVIGERMKQVFGDSQEITK